MLSPAAQDYLKAIYKLQGDRRAVSTTALAGRMGVKPPSVTHMVKHLADLRLVRHHRYRGVELTEAGERLALEIIRHHRLMELYLARALDLPLDRVHDEAERLEHSLSEELEAQIDRVLGHPTSDPHGDPIPTADGRLERPGERSIEEMLPGQTAAVVRIDDADPALVRHLVDLGLLPGVPVQVVEVLPFGGPLRVHLRGQEHLLGREAALAVFVTEAPLS